MNNNTFEETTKTFISQNLFIRQTLSSGENTTTYKKLEARPTEFESQPPLFGIVKSESSSINDIQFLTGYGNQYKEPMFHHRDDRNYISNQEDVGHTER
ncbi:12704_t:CDS:2, partial [Funneliformis mosseae]